MASRHPQPFCIQEQGPELVHANQAGKQAFPGWAAPARTRERDVLIPDRFQAFSKDSGILTTREKNHIPEHGGKKVGRQWKAIF